MATSPNRTPDFNVTAMDPATGAKSTGPLGAAWKNDDGSIGIKLGLGAVLTHGMQIRLWPLDSVPAGSGPRKKTKPSPSQASSARLR